MTVFWVVSPFTQMFTDVSEVVMVSIIALMTQSASTSETSVNLYQTAGRNIPEDNLHTRSLENLKSHQGFLDS
jgi:hypothetical protein